MPGAFFEQWRGFRRKRQHDFDLADAAHYAPGRREIVIGVEVRWDAVRFVENLDLLHPLEFERANLAAQGVVPNRIQPALRGRLHKVRRELAGFCFAAALGAIPDTYLTM